MISDFVKGKAKFNYTTGIQKGITLHRAIDHFTDQHACTKQAKEYFRPVYRLYSGAMVDVVFDHFLAIEPTEFSEESLARFAASVYGTLEQYRVVFPKKFAYMFPYMKEQNWLFNYRLASGTEKSLGGVVRRAVYLTDSRPAFEIFEQEYQPLQGIFRQFWPELKAYAYAYWKELNDKN